MPALREGEVVCRSTIVKGLMESDFSVRTTPLTSSGRNRGAQKGF
jgi:hypothetical protein